MSKLTSYLNRHAAVPGWLDPYSGRFIAALAAIQHDAGLTGPVAEIGVHMGRLFILLKLLSGADEKALAIDIFEDQHLNIDGSGSGNKERFLENLSRYASTENVILIQRSSLELDANDIFASIGPCRLFSIDGGHTEACTFNDLKLADAVLMDAGIAILDDYFNQSWPDVSSGAARFFCAPETSLRPFAITPNKLYLARPHHHEFYRGRLATAQSDYKEKDSVMFGSAVSIFGVEPETHALAKTAKRWIRNSPIGPSALLARQSLRAVSGR